MTSPTNQDTPVAWLTKKTLAHLQQEGSFVGVKTVAYKDQIRSGNAVPLYSFDQLDRMRERAERAEAERAEEWRARREAEASRDTALAVATTFRAERDELRKALEFYANPEIYRPHPHGPAFDRRDLSFHARDALTKLQDTSHE